MSDDEFTFDDAMALRFGTPRIKPKLKLTGEDGNAYFIISRARRVLQKAGYKKEEIDKFEEEATSGDYDNVLSTCMKWFDVS